MQTFLPSPSYQRSAKVLDNKRLGKQRVEAYQILQVLLYGKKSWANHPAVLMWKGYEGALYSYMIAVCDEWVRRGFKNEKMEANRMHIACDHLQRLTLTANKPKWLGNRSFHASHRSNLLRKNPSHYKKFKWRERNNLPYIWPCTNVVNTSK